MEQDRNSKFVNFIFSLVFHHSTSKSMEKKNRTRENKTRKDKGVLEAGSYKTEHTSEKPGQWNF